MSPQVARRRVAGALLIAATAVTGCGQRASPGSQEVARDGSPAVIPSSSQSPDVLEVRDWVLQTGDSDGLPFFIIDKRRARMYVFDAAGRRQADAPVLLGAARGDHTVEGIGERRLSEIRPEEKTTPAGRFLAQRGQNLRREDVVWVDYEAAVSIHRIRATDPRERRHERLASPTALDNRISYGCINVPADFYDSVVVPAFSHGRVLVYILPETRPAAELFGIPGDRMLQARR
jgi:hypothetical protein